MGPVSSLRVEVILALHSLRKMLTGTFIVLFLLFFSAECWGVGGTLRWRSCITTGTKCLDDITGYVDGEPVLIIGSDGFLVYMMDSDSGETADGDLVVAPADVGAGDARWIQQKFTAESLEVTQNSTNPFQMYMYEDSDYGTNYYVRTVPPSIVSNETFLEGRWRIEAKTLTTAGFDIEVDETLTNFVCTITGLTADRPANLPAATGSGVQFVIAIADGDDTYDLQVEPDGTDQIGDAAAGHYLEADGEGEALWLIDAASGKWTVFKEGTWTEES